MTRNGTRALVFLKISIRIIRVKDITKDSHGETTRYATVGDTGHHSPSLNSILYMSYSSCISLKMSKQNINKRKILDMKAKRKLRTSLKKFLNFNKLYCHSPPNRHDLFCLYFYYYILLVLRVYEDIALSS